VSVTRPIGFRAAGVAAGLKSTGDLDLALVVNDGPDFAGAAVFTSNRCRAHPVLWSAEAVKDGIVRAVVLNSGGANCYTGPEGFQTTHAVAERVGDRLGVGAIDVIVCSTGLIGQPNDRNLLLRGVDHAHDVLGSDGGTAAATAIMTTDTVPKQSEFVGDGWSIGGMAKGAAMLAPQLATMLAVITTDALVSAANLDEALRGATQSTFDRLDSDGCMSTNDTVVVMANGASRIAPQPDQFVEALVRVCDGLAHQLIADAEGATHDIAITVVHAATEDDAVEVGRAIARSSLFKAAIFGGDANWGRALASVGTTSAVFDPADLDIAMNGVWVCRNSAPAADPDTVDLGPREVRVLVDLKAGLAEATIWTSDLTHGYVHENSAYSS
jgi:glutamate N-acetyltransferase / amino-acid N-acetyltransferase